MFFKKTHQNQSDCNQFLLKKVEVDKKQIFSCEKLRNSGICIMIALTHSLERIFNPNRYTGFIDFNDCIGKITSKSIRLNPVFGGKKI